MAKILVACDSTVKIDKILNTFTKDELFQPELARNTVGLLLAKNLNTDHLKKITETVTADIEIDADNYLVKCSSGKSQFLIERVVSKLEKFDELDQVLSEIEDKEDRVYASAMVFLMNRKRADKLFTKFSVDEDAYRMEENCSNLRKK